MLAVIYYLRAVNSVHIANENVFLTLSISIPDLSFFLIKSFEFLNTIFFYFGQKGRGRNRASCFLNNKSLLSYRVMIKENV